MLRILINGQKHFCDQIKNKLECIKDEGLFSYTDDLDDASIIISEEDSCPIAPNALVYIEVIRNVETGKLSVAQTIMGQQIEAFPVEDLPYVLQSTIRMMGLILKKQNKITELVKKNNALEEFQSTTVENLKNFKKVQQNTSVSATDLEGFETKLIYLPKDEISGDFLVTKKLLDGRTFIFIGDVTGHGFYAGAYAATLVALTKSYFDMCSIIGADLQQFALYIAKAAFYYHGECEQSSAECVICEINPSKNLARFLTFSGGNISPILIKKNGTIKTIYSLSEEETEEARIRNEEVMKKIKPRIGEPFFEDNVTFESIPGIFETRFNIGDMLLFYTDGFSEMFSQTEGGKKDQNFVYGVENMERAVMDAVSLKGNNPEVVVNSVISDISSFGVKQLGESKAFKDLIYDDATMLCIKREK